MALDIEIKSKQNSDKYWIKNEAISESPASDYEDMNFIVICAVVTTLIIAAAITFTIKKNKLVGSVDAAGNQITDVSADSWKGMTCRLIFTIEYNTITTYK